MGKEPSLRRTVESFISAEGTECSVFRVGDWARWPEQNVQSGWWVMLGKVPEPKGTQGSHWGVLIVPKRSEKTVEVKEA